METTIVRMQFPSPIRRRLRRAMSSRRWEKKFIKFVKRLEPDCKLLGVSKPTKPVPMEDSGKQA